MRWLPLQVALPQASDAAGSSFTGQPAYSFWVEGQALDDLRNTLVAALHGASKIHVRTLQALTNEHLVALADVFAS